jgi:hypothetical protein
MLNEKRPDRLRLVRRQVVEDDVDLLRARGAPITTPVKKSTNASLV